MVESTSCPDLHSLIVSHLYRDTAVPTAKEQHVSYQPMPCHNELFTGREDCLETLRRYFVPRDKSRPRRSFLLYGMGGAGKTQIGLKFAEESSER
jgi:hypothetical protein